MQPGGSSKRGTMGPESGEAQVGGQGATQLVEGGIPGAQPPPVWGYSCLPYSTHCGGGGLVAKSCPTPATPWTAARQAPLSMGFPRKE